MTYRCFLFALLLLALGALTQDHDSVSFSQENCSASTLESLIMEAPMSLDVLRRCLWCGRQWELGAILRKALKHSRAPSLDCCWCHEPFADDWVDLCAHTCNDLDQYFTGAEHPATGHTVCTMAHISVRMSLLTVLQAAGVTDEWELARREEYLDAAFSDVKTLSRIVGPVWANRINYTKALVPRTAWVDFDSFFLWEDWIDVSIYAMSRLLYSFSGLRVFGALDSGMDHENPTGLPAFAFGDNWQDFLVKRHEKLEDLVDRTVRKMKALTLSDDPFKNGSVLDIGSGSGTASLAAVVMGAREVQSIDAQEASVEAALALREREIMTLGSDSSKDWKVDRLSVLDPQFDKLFAGSFDIVYSEGVLMHTGDLYGALRNAARAVARGGVLIVDVYMYDQHVDHDAWLDRKKEYSLSSLISWKKIDQELGVALYYLLPVLRAGIDPFKWMVDTYPSKDFWIDVRDWCGGWPMEFMVASEFIEFADKELGMEVVSTNGNWWVLIRRGDAVEPWRTIMAERQVYTLVEATEGALGYCGRVKFDGTDTDVLATCERLVWECRISQDLRGMLHEALDFNARGRRLMLLRDGKPIGNLRNQRVSWPSVSSDALCSSRVGFYEFLDFGISEEFASVRFALSGDPVDGGEIARYVVAVLPAWADPFFSLSTI